jgi:chromosome segregation ATPase
MRRQQEEVQALLIGKTKDASPAELGEEPVEDLTQIVDSKLEGKILPQKQLLEQLNSKARDVADQLAHMEEERNQLQSSNQELHTMCEQLRNDLHRAAETISKLNERIANQEEEERIRQEQEAQRVEEEESNLVTATRREMELQITHIRESMQAQIVSLENELIEERKLSVDQQHELQRRLEEVTTRLSSSESEMKALASKKEANLAKQLQASEKAAAKAVSLFEKKEEEVQQLQQVIADSEYSCWECRRSAQLLTVYIATPPSFQSA